MLIQIQFTSTPRHPMTSISPLSEEEQLSFVFVDRSQMVPMRTVSQDMSPFVPASEDPGTGLLDLDIPVLLHRSHRALSQRLLFPYEDVQYSSYGFDLINPSASFHFIALNNTPTADSTVTGIEEAVKNLHSTWKEGDYAPIDWHALKFLIENQDYAGEHFMEVVKRQYRKYKKVTLLFADLLYGGPNREPLYILWEYVVGEEMGTLKLAQNVRTHDLAKGEVFIMVVAEISQVKGGHVMENIVFTEQVQALRRENAGPTSAASTTEAVDYENDPRYAFRLAEWINSGLPTREEFIQKHGANAYALVGVVPVGKR